MKWKGKLINHIIEELKEDIKWGNTIEKILIDSSIGIHLAIFNEPFLSLVLNGEKKIESRFSINKISPYNKIKKGDVVIVKESGGFVVAIFVAGNVYYFNHVDKNVLSKIEDDYGRLICTRYDHEFWANRAKANFITLIEIQKIKELTPYKTEKKDRLGWSLIREGLTDNLFNEIS